MVERGQRSEPAWLRAHPGLCDFELEKPPGMQILRNVWDTGRPERYDFVNYDGQRKLAFGKVAPRKTLFKPYLHKNDLCLLTAF